MIIIMVTCSAEALNQIIGNGRLINAVCMGSVHGCDMCVVCHVVCMGCETWCAYMCAWDACMNQMCACHVVRMA